MGAARKEKKRERGKERKEESFLLQKLSCSPGSSKPFIVTRAGDEGEKKREGASRVGGEGEKGGGGVRGRRGENDPFPTKGVNKGKKKFNHSFSFFFSMFRSAPPARAASMFNAKALAATPHGACVLSMLAVIGAVAALRAWLRLANGIWIYFLRPGKDLKKLGKKEFLSSERAQGRNAFAPISIHRGARESGS